MNSSLSSKIEIFPGKYVLAVSGGVDSIVLLDLLTKKDDIELIVAHLNHGIRCDSDEDEELVKKLADKYDLKFVSQRVELGSKASEDSARRVRHNFLKQVKREFNAGKIITAHHSDDIVETIILNIIRGTGPKGLSSLKDNEIFIRPLARISKEEIYQYAKDNNLKWREDSTNEDQSYLRNYIRNTIIPHAYNQDKNFKEKLLEIYSDSLEVNQKISNELNLLEKDLAKRRDNEIVIDRSRVIMLPKEVASTYLHDLLVRLGVKNVTRIMVAKFLHFIQTAKPNKTLQVDKLLHISSTIEEVKVNPETSSA